MKKELVVAYAAAITSRIHITVTKSLKNSNDVLVVEQ